MISVLSWFDAVAPNPITSTISVRDGASGIYMNCKNPALSTASVAASMLPLCSSASISSLVAFCH
jgi:hypothetical protein